MANYTATTSMTLEQAITNGSMVDGEDLTINNGAVVTCNQTPSILVGKITINDGEFFIDGQNIVSGNVIQFVGEYNQQIVVNGLGLLKTRGDWINLGTTNGTDYQSFDLTSYWGGQFKDVVHGVWVETGRRIIYDNAVGRTPVVGEFVYKVSDENVYGRIIEVQPTYLVVKYLTGVLADDDAIHCHGLVDNKGPSNEIFWTANVNSLAGDIKEAGVYQSFANSRGNSVSHIDKMSKLAGGFCFEHTYQTDSLTFAGSLGGFKPPSGCNVRIPNIHITQARSSDYALGNTYYGSAVETSWFRISTTAGGSLDLDTLSIGISFFYSSGAFSVDVNRTAAPLSIGSSVVADYTLINDSVITSDTISTALAFQLILENCISSSIIQDTYLCATSTATAGIFSWGAKNCDQVLYKDSVFTMHCDVSIVNLGILSISASSNVEINNCLAFYPKNQSGYASIIASSSNISLIKTRWGFAQQFENNTSGYFMFSNTNTNMTISCLDVMGLETSTPTGRFIYMSSNANIKLRGIGRLDEPMVYSGPLIDFVGFNENIDIARVYKVGSFTNFSNSSKNIVVNNSGSEYNGRVFPNIASNLIIKGMKGGSGDLGAVTGVELDLPSSYGTNIGDCFRSDTAGQLFLVFCPKTVATSNFYTVTLGAPKFLKDGDLTMFVGDQVEFEQQYFALGHLSFTGVVTFALAAGQTIDGVDEWGAGNVTVEFQYDIGGGYNGTWLDLRNPTNLTSITIQPNIGVKLKIRLTCLVDTSFINGLAIHTTTSLSAQKENLHPIDQDKVEATINVLSGSRVQLYNVTTATELDNVITPSGVYKKEVIATNGDILRLRVTLLGYEPIEAFAEFSGVNIGFVGDQVLDEVYQINGIDGSTMTQYSYDAGNVQIDINDADGETTLQEFWAWYNYFMTTEIGINLVGGFTALDEVNYRINTDLFTFQFENISPLPVRISGGYIYRSDGDLMLADTGSSILMEPAKAYIVNSAQLARKTDIYPLY